MNNHDALLPRPAILNRVTPQCNIFRWNLLCRQFRRVFPQLHEARVALVNNYLGSRFCILRTENALFIYSQHPLVHPSFIRIRARPSHVERIVNFSIVFWRNSRYAARKLSRDTFTMHSRNKSLGWFFGDIAGRTRAISPY